MWIFIIHIHSIQFMHAKILIKTEENQSLTVSIKNYPNESAGTTKLFFELLEYFSELYQFHRIRILGWARIQSIYYLTTWSNYWYYTSKNSVEFLASTRKGRKFDFRINRTHLNV